MAARVARPALAALARDARRRAKARAPRAASSSSPATTLSVVSWNVNGLRSLLKKAPRALDELARRTDADVLVLQETKLGADGRGAVDGEGEAPKFLREYGTREYATSTARKGYSGTAMFIRDGDWAKMKRVEATRLSAGGFDDEGRVLTAELDSCFVVNAYVPNSGADLKRLPERVEVWERAIREHVRALESRGKAVIYCGDLNVAHEEIDLWGRHAENSKSAGFTPEERAAMTRLLDECDLVDTFRAHRPDARAFTYWSYRAGAREKNRGWRLDYILASRRLADSIVDAYALPDVLGSDHCPVGLRVALP